MQRSTIRNIMAFENSVYDIPGQNGVLSTFTSNVVLLRQAATLVRANVHTVHRLHFCLLFTLRYKGLRLHRPHFMGTDGNLILQGHFEITEPCFKRLSKIIAIVQFRDVYITLS